VSGRIEFKENKHNPRVDEAKAWLTDTLNKLRWNMYTMYATLAKKDISGRWPKAYKSQLHSGRHREHPNTFCARYFKDKAVHVLESMKEWLRKETEKDDWAGKSMLEWPEFRLRPRDESSDDDEMEDEEEEVDMTGGAGRRRDTVMKGERAGAKKQKKAGKKKVLSESEIESESEDSPSPQERARRPKKVVIAKRDFTNHTAAGHDRVQVRYDELIQQTINSGGHNQAPKVNHADLYEQARQEIASEEFDENGGGRGARRTTRKNMSDNILPTDITSLNARALRESKENARKGRGRGEGGAGKH
jgi:hypothetical protein